MGKNNKHFVFMLFSLGLHVSTATILIKVFPSLGLPSYWLGEALGCILASWLLAAASSSMPSGGVRLAFLVGRLLLFAMLAMPLGFSLWVVLGLAFALIFDAAYALPPKAGTVLGAAIVAACLLRAVLPLRAWNRDLSCGFSAENIFGLSALCCGFIFVQDLFRLRRSARRDAAMMQQLNDSILALTSANRGFLNYASAVERESIAKERSRLTRDIHDAVSSTLTNIKMMMEAALRRDWEEQGELIKLHQWTRDQAQKGLQETRSILYLIRSIEEPEIKGVREIQNLVQTFMEATRVAVVVDWGNIPWSWQNDYVNMTVFRIIQEGMTNSFRHGHATEIKIYFFQNEAALNIRIEDNGEGSEDFAKGIGLSGMEERLKPIGGTINAYSTDSGFRLVAQLPIGAYLRVAGASDETASS